jgi:transposase InsO family protein
MGRDKFESLCKAYGFAVRSKVNGRRTTDSSGVIRFENLAKDLKLTNINQMWSSDITYFEIGNVFYYLTFYLDCFSRRIIGHQASTRLLTEHTTIPALRMAIKTREKEAPLPREIIHHSDGGGQYYDQRFIELTDHHGFRNSMCEYAYQNGKSERINGIIKNNYLRHWEIKNFAELTKKVDRAVYLYNSDKPHISLSRSTPIEFEKKLVNLELRNRLKMTESLETKKQIDQGSALTSDCETGLKL